MDNWPNVAHAEHRNEKTNVQVRLVNWKPKHVYIPYSILVKCAIKFRIIYVQERLTLYSQLNSTEHRKKPYFFFYFRRSREERSVAYELCHARLSCEFRPFYFYYFNYVISGFLCTFTWIDLLMAKLSY